MIIKKISRKIRHLGNKKKSEIEEHRREKKMLSLLEDRLSAWVAEGKHRERYGSMEEIAEELGVTRSELASYFSKIKHMTFQSWRTALRIEEAKHLMDSEPQMSISQLSLTVGIADKSDFRHQFKRIEGCTPSEYRSRNKKSR